MKPSPLFTAVKTRSEAVVDVKETATYKGVAIKTAIFLLLTLATAALAYFFLPKIIENVQQGGNSNALTGYIIAIVVTSIISLIAAIVGRVSDRAALVAGSIYALAEGFLVGSITALVDTYMIRWAGMLCVFATFIIFGVMLLLYALGIIRVNNIFRAILLGFFIGLIALIPFTIILMFVGRLMDQTQLLWICFGIEAFLLLYGVITLTLNFAEAEAVVKSGAPKQAEWSVALGMEISLVYIYIELLRLLIIIASLVDRN